MTRTYKDNEHAIEVAKRALWLAWIAARGPSGMGIFQDNPSASADDVWNNAIQSGDYPGRIATASIDADYVFGRMLKLRFNMPERGKIDVPESKPNIDYQGWCHKYPSYSALFDSAEQDVRP